MGRILTVFAVTMLVSAWWVGMVHATGTGNIEMMTAGVREVSATLRGSDIVEGISLVLAAFLVLGVITGHANNGFMNVFIGLIAIGGFFGAEQVLEAAGWQAVGF